MFADNKLYGIYLTRCYGAEIENNNFINNSNFKTSQAFDDNDEKDLNKWTNNFWSDWIHPDLDNDGIVDEVYVINGTVVINDSHPLVESLSLSFSNKTPSWVYLPVLLVLVLIAIQRRK